MGAPTALVDCNNFYASCERVFQPRLRGKPVVVLSNNNGCVIARSNEAKALGVEMGAPWHLCRESFRKTGVVVRWSNYTAYGDMSARVMRVLSNFTPNLEIYSIDEVAGLAIPHGEFEPACPPSRRGRCSRSVGSRSLMGSSNPIVLERLTPSRKDSRSPMGCTNSPFRVALSAHLAIPHGEFELVRPNIRKSRRPGLAIPHGEFEHSGIER